MFSAISGHGLHGLHGLIKDDTLPGQAVSGEIHDQADLNSCGFQVRNRLGAVNLGKLRYAFQFNDDFTRHDQIYAMPTDPLSFVKDINRKFGLNRHAARTELTDHRALINRLKIPGAEYSMNLYCCPDDFFGDRLRFHAEP